MTTSFSPPFSAIIILYSLFFVVHITNAESGGPGFLGQNSSNQQGSQSQIILRKWSQTGLPSFSHKPNFEQTW